MTRITCSPKTEVIGRLMVSYAANIQAEIAGPIMKKHGLTDIKPDRWYRLRPWLAVMDELAARPDFTSSMISVGLKIVEHIVAPPEMKGVPLGYMLEGWNKHFQANHRNGEVGHIITEKVDDTRYRTIHRHIYPDGINYGLAYGFAANCLPRGTDFVVEYEDYDHRLDRGGGDETVIVISWK